MPMLVTTLSVRLYWPVDERPIPFAHFAALEEVVACLDLKAVIRRAVQEELDRHKLLSGIFVRVEKVE
jgi:hypothetical protein